MIDAIIEPYVEDHAKMGAYAQLYIFGSPWVRHSLGKHRSVRSSGRRCNPGN